MIRHVILFFAAGFGTVQLRTQQGPRAQSCFWQIIASGRLFSWLVGVVDIGRGGMVGGRLAIENDEEEC